MSGFIKRERTVNPAGGLNPASIPNAGQYGWTNYDSAVVNQLIQYVEMAKASGESAAESAKYVQDQLILVDNYTQFIMDGIEDFEAKYVDSLDKYATLSDIYANIVSIHEVIVKYDADITKYAKEAYDSAQDAKSWAYVSYVTCLDAKGELTKGVDWTATSGAFPAVPAANTIYTVKTTTPDVGLGGFVWNDGDHLVYTLREAKFNQIKKSFYTFTTRSETLIDTIAELQREISEIKETINGYVFE